MNLWFSVHFLFAGLYLSSSAPTPEECQGLVKPLSLIDHSVIYGRLNFIMGFADNEAHRSALKATGSSWMKISPSPDHASSVLMAHENRLNGTCSGITTKVDILGDTLVTDMHNVTSTSQVLQIGSDSFGFIINSTARDLGKLLALMKLDGTFPDLITSRVFYAFSRESTMTDSDLEHFKKQASCLGFTGEPDFHYDPKTEFCAEGEGVRVSLP
ncbi:uncharacterized protein LOC128368699 [Scomber japonicus]|uniref:uncharacterized protein LOC128368699 n=1 Tax=Scomber japonicus TaxID=13676 RepID=UPI002304FEBE|nr:uncharacterized protein LOC128368699 [Scomber japonicus]